MKKIQEESNHPYHLGRENLNGPHEETKVQVRHHFRCFPSFHCMLTMKNVMYADNA